MTVTRECPEVIVSPKNGTALISGHRMRLPDLKRKQLYDRFPCRKSITKQTLDEHFDRAMSVKSGDFAESLRYSRLLVSHLEGVMPTPSPNTTPSSRAVSQPKNYLQRMSCAVVMHISEYLDPQDFCNLRASSRVIEQSLRHPVTNKVAAPNLTCAAENVEHAEFFHRDSVKTMNLGRCSVDPSNQSDVDMSDSSTIDFPDNFPNCRTVTWRPEVKYAPKKGDYVESRNFCLQGMKDLYLRLYPLGKERSKAGHCSLYMGSSGTEKDVMLRLRIGKHSHIIAQKLSPDYVDGFVNFCAVDLNSDFEIFVEVIHGPNDVDVECQKLEIPVCGGIAKWSIPRISKETLQSFAMGDRITSDTFTLPALGEEACFVIYPKGDTVDAISHVGNFVNVGLFGSAEKDVTFRLSSGGVSKVLTATADRFSTKMIGMTKSCGEFFDACFGSIDELLEGQEEDGRLNLKLDVLDTCSHHHFKHPVSKPQHTNPSTVWNIDDVTQLQENLLRDESMYSRYFGLMEWSGKHDSSNRPTWKQIPGVFHNYGIAFADNGDIIIDVFVINGGLEYITANCEVSLKLNDGDYATQRARQVKFEGLKDSRRFIFKGLEKVPLRNLKLDVTLSNVQRPTFGDMAGMTMFHSDRSLAKPTPNGDDETMDSDSVSEMSI